MYSIFSKQWSFESFICSVLLLQRRLRVSHFFQCFIYLMIHSKIKTNKKFILRFFPFSGWQNTAIDGERLWLIPFESKITIPTKISKRRKKTLSTDWIKWLQMTQKSSNRLIKFFFSVHSALLLGIHATAWRYMLSHKWTQTQMKFEKKKCRSKCVYDSQRSYESIWHMDKNWGCLCFKSKYVIDIKNVYDSDIIIWNFFFSQRCTYQFSKHR